MGGVLYQNYCMRQVILGLDIKNGVGLEAW